MSVSALADGEFLTSAIWETVREQVAWSCTSSTRPTGVNGRVISETDTDRFAKYDGSAWQYIDVTPWTAYTPAWSGLTVGNGTYAGETAFRYVGDAIEVRGRFVLGSTSAITGSLSQTVPDSQTLEALTILADIKFEEDGGSYYQAAALVSPQTAVQFRRQAVSGTDIVISNISSSVPFAWGTGDEIMWHYLAKLA